MGSRLRGNDIYGSKELKKMLTDILWGKKSRFSYLFVASVILLFAFLGTREIWTQEHRWADIVFGMFYRHDFLHPYLGEANYYDKPLLSYWLIAAISLVTGHFSTWALRLPSALAGLLGIWSIYRIGTHCKDKQLGLLSGWMLLTTFYFVFWARTSSADMLNLAGSLFAVSWYFDKKEASSFFNYSVFFLILAVTSLCKGLVGAVVPLLAILPDLLMKNEWKKHLRLSFFLGMIPAAILYYLPFWASAQFGGDGYQESGLYLVYRENVLRYFQPFDHKGPIYTYFIFLPIYLMPWTLFFIPALFSLKSRWKNLSNNSKWMVWSVLLLFLFFTLSGSRRNYYVLPLVPFAILMTADWIAAEAERLLWASRLAVFMFVGLVLHFNVLQPLYYSQGITVFADKLKTQASAIHPWASWKVVLLDPESKVSFYLELPPQVKTYDVQGLRQNQTQTTLTQAWPILKTADKNTIFVTRKMYELPLRLMLKNYTVVESTPNLGERILKIDNQNDPVAFIPPQ
jgi:4-amino-4-deoxy-L-arabinose transferase-like glycosyltransferase